MSLAGRMAHLLDGKVDLAAESKAIKDAKAQPIHAELPGGG